MLGSVSAEFALSMLFLCFVAWRAERAWERAQLRRDAAAFAKCAVVERIAGKVFTEEQIRALLGPA